MFTYGSLICGVWFVGVVVDAVPVDVDAAKVFAANADAVAATVVVVDAVATGFFAMFMMTKHENQIIVTITAIASVEYSVYDSINCGRCLRRSAVLYFDCKLYMIRCCFSLFCLRKYNLMIARAQQSFPHIHTI